MEKENHSKAAKNLVDLPEFKIFLNPIHKYFILKK